MEQRPGQRSYELRMAQNPIRARMCGFGEKDRRPMDPPPILKLVVRNEDGTLADVSQMDVNFYMVIADIYSADQSTPCTLVTNPSSSAQPSSSSNSIQGMGDSSMSVLTLSSATSTASRNLTGSTVASGNLLFDLENELGVYFVFQDISVRSEGTFTLKFSFTLPPVPDSPPSTVMANVFSEAFTIYSAKRFPGMTESTALSKCFAKQGIKIPIRKEPRISRTKRVQGQTVPTATEQSQSSMSSKDPPITTSQETSESEDDEGY